MKLTAWVVMRTDAVLRQEVLTARKDQRDSLAIEFGSPEAGILAQAMFDGFGTLEILGETIDQEAVIKLFRKLVFRHHHQAKEYDRVVVPEQLGA